MAAPDRQQRERLGGKAIRSRRIRNNALILLSLLTLIVLQVAFLINYSGFHTWQRIDANLPIFVAVNVNIVLFTAVFYLILRHFFKLVYERKHPLGGVSLKTKLIVAFVALSLPSTAFHLMASGFIAQLFHTWSLGEYRQVLENTRVLRNAIGDLEHRLLERSAEQIVARLPREPQAYRDGQWLDGYPPELRGGISVYGGRNQLLSRWTSHPELTAFWTEPPSEYFHSEEGFYWIERNGDHQIRRLIMPLDGAAADLKVEVMSVAPQRLSQAVMALEYKEASKTSLGRDLLLLVLTILIGITLLIIFAATWIAFYLARGFVTPVERLSEGTQRVSEGELGYQVQGNTLGPLQNDFQVLVDSFNRMSRQLKEQRLQLIETAENLRSKHQELGERNRFVELLLENIDVGILSLNSQGRITTLNRWAFRLLQLRKDSFLQRHYRGILNKDLAVLLDDMLERVRLDPRRRATQNVNLSVNRKPLVVEVSALPLEKEDGTSEGVMVMLEDVTDLQRTQRALAWREVARRVAHEIKNPLTPVQLSAQRIRRRYLEELGERGEVLDHSTQTIIDEVSSLKKMVNEFSEFAKMPESKPTPDDLNQVIREVVRLYETSLGERVRLELDLDESLPLLPLDREQLRRVFSNLVENAGASIPSTGTITLRTEYQAAQGVVLAEVIDDGVGVPDEVRSRLFEPYTSTKEGGTGLGLTIVNQIVSDHKGYIRYSDRKPSGSIFCIEFRLR